MADYSKKTQELLDRQCRNVERGDFILDKKSAEECILKTYDLFNLSRPKEIKWCIDIFDKSFDNAAWSASSASSAWSAWSARSASSAWSAWSASSAWSAWSARSASSARSAWSASSASSAWSASSALDYDFDYYIFEFEYCKNPNEELPINQNDEIYLEYCELLMQAKEYGLGYRVEWKDILYLVPTPLVKINSLNQWHSDTVPAIQWKNGEEFYYLNNVSFPKDLWQKVTSRKIIWKEILAIEDIDQRTQAMRYGNEKDFAKLGTIVDSYKKMSLEGKEVNYQLIKIPQGIFTTDAYFAFYDCPSTDRKYLSGIDPQIGVKGSIAEAMSWKHHLLVKDWKQLVPLEHES